MSVPVTTHQPAIPSARPGLLALAGTVLATAAACAGVTILAPEPGRVWVTATAVAAGVAIVVSASVVTVTLRRARLREVSAGQQVEQLRSQLGQAGAELAHARAEAGQLAEVTLPSVLGHLRDGASADTALDRVPTPHDPQLARLLEWCAREIAVGERRSMAAMAASAKGVDRVQAQANTILAHLRDMQDRYDEDVLGDLLTLDHNTSQLSLLADRLAVLMGGRSSRQWNKPIVMESILRGASGRIAAYQRVRLHCTSTVAIAGHAAEGVMHLLAELMDNATTFSPPTDEVHVYVEERTAGIVVTIEDSGLKMADAALRRAEETVAGAANDLATLQGTRLGLAVVGRLATKYQMTVSFRPSSRGGTGVVVLIPQHLIAQHRTPVPAAQPPREQAPQVSQAPQAPQVASPPAAAVPAPTETRATERTAELPPVPARVDGDLGSAPAGALPKRPRGRTLASAERQPLTPPASAPPPRAPGEAGSRFSAFRQASRGRTDGPSDPLGGLTDPLGGASDPLGGPDPYQRAQDRDTPEPPPTP
ncbi:sensor histidine kinase [Streptomyces sp. JJ66]|uniref:sensor histidine kinase n=1 Tax=Streptomyces sp. JJ66 TaxID=2803843 RepID=UPI001C588EF2|nr:ATP-binding protein [Streptomyces sp. JJ66]MBW1603637.1 sensor histidine kinase [Streptomyces sp. JJ66]